MANFGRIFFVGSRGGLHSMGGHFSESAGNPDIWEPAADLLEVEGGFLVQVDLPGVDARSVEAVIDGQTLLIRGVRRALCPSRSKRYIHMEVSRGEFGKAITLPETVAEESCQATLRDGVLEIFLPFGSRPIFAITQLRIKTFR
ncbi:MAG: Hsp20/alpha crystallin family protein [Planctomycetota bacterium]|jgi:HSP20 family protein|nr:Hsp20/alpha crystallin family protein [Planctomycetota bacterium]